MARTAGSASLTEGGSLTLAQDQAAWFPLLNGSFRLGGQAGTYRYRGRVADTLYGIFDRDNPQRAFAVRVSPSVNVQLEPLFLLRAAGAAGTGTVETRRAVDFFVQIPTEQTVSFQETFDDPTLPNWQASTLGSLAVATVDGDKALRVTGTAPGAAGAPKVSLIAFKPLGGKPSIWPAPARSSGGFLSYDAQIKVGFVADQTPQGGFDPSPVPKYFAAGLSFRLDRSEVEGNFYGLSLLRGDNSVTDNLPNAIVPQDDRLLLVLWQQTGLGASPHLAGLQGPDR